jgi:pimeloyl-ACP methyl ester carboxylesterase
MTRGHDARAPEVSSYASVNGLQMYYEIHGTGRPLVLLHGALSAIGTSFGELLPALAETRRVIAFELQAHGRTADIDRPLSIEQMADDTAAALRQLGIAKADIFGYSMGASVALHLAIRHPDVVRKARARLGHLQPERRPPRAHGRISGHETRNDVWVSVARGIRPDSAESGKFRHAVRQKDADGSEHQGRAGRGHSVDQGAHPAHYRRF